METTLRKTRTLALLALPASLLVLGYASAHARTAPASNPLASLARAPLDEPPLRGVIEQRLAAGHYSYLALRTPEGALRWAVTMGQGEPLGTHVSVRSVAHGADFYSARLQRHFHELSFGVVSRDSQEAR